MFEKAIGTVSSFTRPILSISRNYESTIIQRGAATLFFVNAEGWALTCGHVAQQLIAGEQLGSKRQAFLQELESSRGKKNDRALRHELEKQYGYSKKAIFELYNNFFGCIEGPLDAELKIHNTMDVALIHFRNFTRLLCDTFPTFPANTTNLKSGKFLCRLGFPFAEFSNYAYEESTDRIN